MAGSSPAVLDSSSPDGIGKTCQRRQRPKWFAAVTISREMSAARTFSETDPMSDQALKTIERGMKFPYDAPDAWREDADDTSLPPSAPDWAHMAARGIIADLTDRRDIKNGFNSVDEDTRIEIVRALAEIIRQAKGIDDDGKRHFAEIDAALDAGRSLAGVESLATVPKKREEPAPAHRYRNALIRIAAYGDHEASARLLATNSYAGFDEPASVRIAREALKDDPVAAFIAAAAEFIEGERDQRGEEDRHYPGNRSNAAAVLKLLNEIEK